MPPAPWTMGSKITAASWSLLSLMILANSAISRSSQSSCYAGLRCGGEELFGDDLVEHLVHAGDGIADGHGGKGVAMVAAAQAE